MPKGAPSNLKQPPSVQPQPTKRLRAKEKISPRCWDDVTLGHGQLEPQVRKLAGQGSAEAVNCQGVAGHRAVVKKEDDEVQLATASRPGLLQRHLDSVLNAQRKQGWTKRVSLLHAPLAVDEVVPQQEEGRSAVAVIDPRCERGGHLANGSSGGVSVNRVERVRQV